MRTKREIETCFAARADLDGVTSFFLVGIGGAGMSGIARMLHRRGFRVRGTDSTDGEGVHAVRALGIPVTLGHSASEIEAGDALVLTDAIDLQTSPEVARGVELGCKLFRRSQVLGWLLRDKKTIAVTGTHGKTTTTGMVGAALIAAGLDPTIVVGAEVPDFGGAVVEGSGEWAVIEACEAYDSLRDFDPTIALLTNLELDHVDFHGDWRGLERSVLDFLERVPESGRLIYCAEDNGAKAVASQVGREALGYSLENADGPKPEFMPGRHNRLNALGALLASLEAGASRELAIQGIEAFSGAGRRLQVLREGPIAVVDDYAHHPTEIAASIQALRERFPNRRMVVVYQPHLYSRTAGLIPEFAESLSAADLLVITDIYPAREAPMPGVSSARIAEAARCPVRYVPQRHMLPRFVADLALPGDLIVGMGAGNIAEFAPNFLAEIDRTGPTRVCIAFGGDSAEREISLHSGQQVLAALLGKGYEARLLDVSELLLTGGSVADLIGPQRPDVAFLAVHGTHAEDGAIQGFFELLHIPYTGSGMQASALAMNKHLTKRVLAAHGLPVPLGWLIGPDETWDEVEGDRFVVKPNEQGSTVGLSFVDDPAQLGHAIANALQYGDQALVEECVQGTEISVPVLGDWVLPPVEIVPASGTYDFAAKYLPGATEEICPARLPEDILARAQDHALRAHRALGCRGATRTDMIVREDSTCVILEVNTLPGMTATSLLPNSARVAGVPFAELCAWIVEDALSRKASS